MSLNPEDKNTDGELLFLLAIVASLNLKECPIRNIFQKSILTIPIYFENIRAVNFKVIRDREH